MEKSKCIVSCAFRQPYLLHNERQMSIVEQNGIDMIAYRDQLPYSEGIVKEDVVARFQRSLYGFKPHAIQQALNRGYKLIVWFDPSVLPTTDLNELFKELEQTDMFIVRGDRSLSAMTNDKAYSWFGLNKQDTININHIGGTFYGFNFNNPKTVEVFNLWKQAEEAGIFGTQDEFMAGHWADESCMALSMFKCGVEQKCSTKLKYLNQKEI